MLIQPSSSLLERAIKLCLMMVPPPCSQPAAEFETKLSPDKMKVIRQEIATLLAKGAIRDVSAHEAASNPGHYSKIFAVPKPGGKWRVVINLKPLNEFVAKESFRMETVKDVPTLI